MARSIVIPIKSIEKSNRKSNCKGSSCNFWRESSGGARFRPSAVSKLFNGSRVSGVKGLGFMEEFSALGCRLQQGQANHFR